jgi:sec-independent protein translocase protein TatA
MSLGIWELVLILLIVVVLFGAGKLPKVMHDLGLGLRKFKDGLKGDESSQPSKDSKQDFEVKKIKDAKHD